MRDLQIGSGDGVVAVEEDVEVDEARAFGEGFFAAHLRFNVAQSGEELKGGKIGLRCQDGIQKPRLVEKVDGLGFIDSGDFFDVDIGFGEKANGLAQVFFAVANVGTQRKIDGNHVRLLFYASAAAKKAEHGVGFG